MAEEFDDLEDRLRRHEAMIEGLSKVWTRQGEINEELRTFNRQQGEINARVETTLARVVRGSGNGREA
jgi:hypothetical protein